MVLQQRFSFKATKQDTSPSINMYKANQNMHTAILLLTVYKLDDILQSIVL